MDPEEPVLVVLVKQAADLELARWQHWYRIPARHAPSLVTQASYLAFYLTKAFGADKWSIREYAPVRGHELVRRQDLFPGQAGHPRAKQAYYKLQLGPLVPLPRPITSRMGRRILFIWTTGAKFSRAVEINDLLSKSQADDALWDDLKIAGVTAERDIVVKDGAARYRVDFWIPCTRGNLAIFLNSGQRRILKSDSIRCLYLNDEDILDHRNDCLGRITGLVRELGEIDYSSEQSA